MSRPFHCLSRSLAFSLALTVGSARAETLLHYAARFTDASGAPATGTVAVRVSFHDAATGGATLLTLEGGALAAVPLQDGVASLPLALSDAEAHLAFAGADQSTWIQVTDLTRQRVYPRQRFGVVPYARKIPIDGSTLAYDDDGKLTVQLASTPLALGTLTAAQEAAATASYGAADKGKTWFNADIGQLRYWNGSAAQTLGTAGAGLQSLGGLTGNDQHLAVTVGGATLGFTHAGDTHTLRLPLASTSGVAAGLLSHAEHAAFTAKVDGPASAVDGALARFDGTTGKALKASGVVVDDAGRVGIGTTSPAMPLTVAYAGTAGTTVSVMRLTPSANPTGTGAGSALELGWNANGTSVAKIGGYWDGAGTALGLFTANGFVAPTQTVTILGSGSVGIGTTTPAKPLEVTRAGTLGIRHSNGSGSSADFGLGGSSSFMGASIASNGAVRATWTSNGGMALATYASGLSDPPANGLIVPGSVGIGTTSPATALHVVGTITAGGVVSTGAPTSPGSGATSERYGAGATAAGINGVAFGNAATAGHDAATVVGTGAASGGTSSVAVGTSAAAGTASAAVGATASASGVNAAAFGSGASAAFNNAVALGQAATAGAASSIAIGSGAATTAANQLVVGSGANPIDDVFFGKGASHAAPTTATLHGTAGSGTDVAGGALHLAGGRGTGTGEGGSISFLTAGASGTTGAAANALGERMRITPGGAVGIGVTSPSGRLHVQLDGVNDGTTLLALGTNGNTNTFLDASYAGTSQFRVAAGGNVTAAGRLTIDGTGAGMANSDDMNYLGRIRGTLHAGGWPSYGLRVEPTGVNQAFAAQHAISGVMAGASGSQPNFGVSGINTSTSSASNYGVMGTATGSGAGTNVGGYFMATGASGGNYALLTGAGHVGLGTTTPTSPLHVAGAVATAVATRTAAATLGAADSIVAADATGGAFTLTLPAASGASGRQYTIKKTDASANAVTVATTGGDTIDGASSHVLGDRYAHVTVASTGSGWLVVSASAPRLRAASTYAGGTVYTATADMIVVANGVHSGTVCGIYGYTDTTATPSTQVMIAASPNIGNWTSGTFAVRKGDNWRVTHSCTSFTLYAYEIR